MQYNRRIVPPSLTAARRPSTEPPNLRVFDEDWEDIETTRRVARAKLALFPPARSDAEIEAIVDEFAAELCGPYY
jgi:hypothetical protein